jgi:hypothetical protein
MEMDDCEVGVTVDPVGGDGAPAVRPLYVSMIGEYGPGGPWEERAATSVDGLD